MAGKEGNSFIEILLVLPILLTVIFGSIGIFQWMQISYLAGEAAQAGVQEWAATGDAQAAQQQVHQTLSADGYPSSVVSAVYAQQGALDEITVSLPVNAPMWPYSKVASTRSAFQGAGEGNGSSPWW
jgi:Flp pilus assembly protein TadG